jgi:hypothetical protein
MRMRFAILTIAYWIWKVFGLVISVEAEQLVHHAVCSAVKATSTSGGVWHVLDGYDNRAIACENGNFLDLLALA